MTSWETASSGYDRRKFYTQVTDKKGHWHQYNIKLPTTIGGEISKIVQSGVVEEYTSAQSFIRDAIVHRLEFISRLIADGELNRRITLFTLNAEAMQIKARREEFRQMLMIIKENCQDHSNHGRLEELRTYVSDLLDSAASMPKEFRSDYIAELEGQLKLTQRPY